MLSAAAVPLRVVEKGTTPTALDDDRLVTVPLTGTGWFVVVDVEIPHPTHGHDDSQGNTGVDHVGVGVGRVKLAVSFQLALENVGRLKLKLSMGVGPLMAVAL